MCLLDYDYHILDNAFLVHKPGVKAPRDDPIRRRPFSHTYWLIKSKIKDEIQRLYGVNENCSTKHWYGR